MHIRHKLPTPSQALAALFSSDGSLLGIGCDDGSFRIYDARAGNGKVKKAVRGLSSGVSAVVFCSTPPSTLRLQEGQAIIEANVWLASGRTLFRFDLSEADSRLVLSPADAATKIDVGITLKQGVIPEGDEEDSINSIALSANEELLAFTTDDGGVYSLKVATGELSRMRASHSSIAWSAVFIPGRTNELVSGGYDCTLLHSDVRLQTRLSELEIKASPGPAPGFGSVPPFIIALAVSPQGCLAAGLADGRIFVGLGGVKASQPRKQKKKRTGKWNGLIEEEGFYAKVAEVMIVGLAFVDEETFVSCTVNGQVMKHTIVNSHPRPSAETQSQSQCEVSDMRSCSDDEDGSQRRLKTEVLVQSSCQKVDALALLNTAGTEAGFLLAICGLHEDGRRGCIEVWASDSESDLPLLPLSLPTTEPVSTDITDP